MLLLTLVVLSQAASDYPKVSRRDGKICVQVLNAKRTVDESCRAEGSEVRTPLPAETAEGSVVHPVRPVRVGLSQPAPAPAAVTASQIYWAEAKREWGLAFKFGFVAGLTSTLASVAGFLIASGSQVP